MAACAARRGTHGFQRPDLDTARLILESGADVNLGSPLFRAAYCNHVDVVRLLLEFRAEVDRRDIRGARPPDGGREAGARRRRARPLGRGRRRRRERGEGQGALYYACCAGHTSTAQLLLDRGADVSARNGRDPFRPRFPEICTKISGKSARPSSRRCGPAPRASRPRTRLKARLARYETNAHHRDDTRPTRGLRCRTRTAGQEPGARWEGAMDQHRCGQPRLPPRLRRP